MNHTERRLVVNLQKLKRPTLIALQISFLGFFSLGAEVRAQLSGDYPSSTDNALLGTIPGESNKGTLLDPTTPMDLMNRLRRARSMQDATSPADAIDEALRALEANTSPPLPPDALAKPKIY